jgi:hypothetical protein
MDAGCVRETDVKCIVWERGGAFSRKQKKGQSRNRGLGRVPSSWLVAVDHVGCRHRHIDVRKKTKGQVVFLVCVVSFCRCYLLHVSTLPVNTTRVRLPSKRHVPTPSLFPHHGVSDTQTHTHIFITSLCSCRVNFVQCSERSALSPSLPSLLMQAMILLPCFRSPPLPSLPPFLFLLLNATNT